MIDLIKNNMKVILNLTALLVIAALFYYSYKYEINSLDSLTISFEKSFKLSSGFTFRVTNNSETDLGSVKMIISPKFDPAADYVCYPRRILFRNGFTLHETSDFVNASGAYFIPPAGGGSLEIYIECRSADGRFYSALRKVEYK
jgi:hypothetical protein